MFYKTILKVACVVLTICWGLQAQAQTKTISGQTVDDSTGEVISGVTIKVKNGPQTAVSNSQGIFTMNISAAGATLQYSHIGYEYGELRVTPGDSIRIKIKRQENKLDEIVVIGYGTQNKRNITGSIATIDPAAVADNPVASITEALRGQIPGLNVSGGSTRPGTLATLDIRQQFNWGKDNGNNLPLIVIDDVIQVDPQTGLNSLDRFNQLDLSEVESITVVRDAAAAIYGSRASQGALIVKTKRGKIGAPRVTYNAKFETNNAVSHAKVMNARQFGEFSNRFGRAAGWNTNNLYTDNELASMDSLNYDWLANDWRAANAMQHSLDLSGGAERATYFTGVSYYTQSPNLGSQDFKRWTYRGGTDVKLLSGLRLGVTIAAANTNLEKSFSKINFSDGFAVGGEQNDYNVLLHMPKYIPWSYNINGMDQYISPPLSSNRLGSASGNNSLSNYNYYALMNNGSKTTNKQFNYNVNFSLQYDVPFIKGLAFKVNYGLSQASGNTEQNMFPILLYQNKDITSAGQHLFSEVDPTHWAAITNKANTRVTYDNTTSKNEQSNFFVTYDRKFGEHSLSAMASVERATNSGEDRYQIYDTPNADIYNGTSISAGTLNTSNTITYRYEGGSLSYLGRLNYSFKNRYLLQFVFRSDASTVFAPENYWGFFPALSAGWVMSDEKFIRDNLPWVNFLKIRANVGHTGNNNIKPWKWLQVYGAQTDKGFGFGSNGGMYVTGLTPGVTPNREVRWDNTLQRNFGLDMAFLKNRLSVTFDQYFNSTRDMLTDMSKALNSPISVGGAFAEQNFAAVNAWGTELSVNWKDNIGDFNYSIGVNTGFSNYKTVKYFDQAFNYPSITSTARAIGNYAYAPVWGFSTWKQTSGGDGILRTDADIDNYWNYLTQNAANSGIAGAAPNFMGITTKSAMKKGMLVYQDEAGALDANGKTIAGPNGSVQEDEDYVKLRKSNRSYGLTTNISLGWRNLSLRTQIATSWGGDRMLDYIKQGTSSTNAMWSQPIYLVNMYDSTTNPNGRYPNLYYYDAFGGANSDFFMLPTFRMVVRSLSVGYALPVAWVKKAGIQNARVYLSGNNLWDLYNPYPNKYRNMYDDPKSEYPTLRTWALGLSVGF
ncbi:SusC/RagA family TonB-linked outer membrane protein [Niabella soli]|uniref:TonB-denpendent receptor n=1 Tax=Niabella soli DSM 19437 TaxID=929713 RepID=W0F1F8_9BACT|nr:SusC/RagA family TonB-linked outer membrane protein [Niabella soli]AHF16847.1 TonB-denpendent receptor [Niabella soli DSM 19437]